MSTTFLIILGVVLIISLFMYIIARIRMSKDKLVLSSGRWDVTFLMITPLFAIIGTLIYKLLPFTTLAWILWIIAGACMSLSIMYSIIDNKDSVWDIVYSVGAKIFIVVTTVFIIILSLVVFLIYLIFYLVKEHNKSDDEDSENKITIPQYRKFMNAYVGLKDSNKKPKRNVEDVPTEEVKEVAVIDSKNAKSDKTKKSTKKSNSSKDK